MTRRSVTTDQTHALARLATDVARLRREVDDLADLHTVMAAHGRALEELSAVVGRGDAGRMPVIPPARTTSRGQDEADGEEPAPAWLTVVDPAAAIRWLNELAVWVPQVWQPYLQTKTPACWPWHADVVAELLVVQHLWTLAAADGAAPDALAAWHDRWRPGAARRVERRMAGCDRSFGRHKDDQHKENVYDVACLDEVAEWWATTRGSDPTRPAPGLTLDDGR
ncbi:MAG: hypothetical protein HY828_22215 [Actinobacteria bacterium]|nr:hypothetical protein [Actinomycetota bacterium]